jgi:enoyl-CoA hydratase
MMSELVRYELNDGVATVTMDDGKANVWSPAMQQAIRTAFDRADADEAAVVLTGREGRFSAGFDLQVITAGGQESVDMVIGGFELAVRLLERDRPIVIACTGHAMAMGAFVLLAGDDRIGAAGAYKIGANEVAIGMTMPFFAIEMMRLRLSPAGVQRSAVLAEVFDPIAAVGVGYLDHIVDPDHVVSVAQERAAAYRHLHPRAHRETKQRLRGDTIARLRDAIEVDRADLLTALG